MLQHVHLDGGPLDSASRDIVVTPPEMLEAFRGNQGEPDVRPVLSKGEPGHYKLVGYNEQTGNLEYKWVSL